MANSTASIKSLNAAAQGAGPSHDLEEIKKQCSQLHLPGLSKYFEDNCGSAEFAGLGMQDLVWHLLNAELSSRRSRRYTRLRAEARLPSFIRIHELAGRLPQLGLSKSTLDMLVSGRWCDSGSLLLLTGKSGTGKTDFMCGLLDGFAWEGMRTRYYDYSTLMLYLSTLLSAGSLDAYRREIAGICRNRAVALDDMMIAARRSLEENCVKDLLDAALQSGTGIIIASQAPIGSWHSYFGGGISADAVMDRLMRGTYRIEFGGESRRARPVTDPGGADGR